MAGKVKKLRKLYPWEIERYLGHGPMFDRKGEDFREYQDWMSDRIERENYLLLAADMGLGKTGAVLKALARLKKAGKCKRVLVVAPLNVARDTWPEEIETWDFSRDLSYACIVGDERERIFAAEQEVFIHIVNRERLVWLWRFFGASKWPYDTIIYDEASRLKGGELETKPTKRKDGTLSQPKVSEFGALARARKFTQRVVEMSGTPSPNGLQDLWGPAYILDRGQRLGAKKTAFMARWFMTNPYSREIKPQDHAFREITGLMKDVMVTLREKDYLDLPPLIPSYRYINLSPEVMAKYERLEETFLLEEHDVEAVNSGVLANKLLQLSNGSIYTSESKAEFLHDEKLDALESIVTEANGEPVLVAYSFKFDLPRIKARFPKFRIYGETKNDLRDWNAGRLPGLILHPASAAHGLNFQYGGSIAVWYGLTWSLELYQQLVKRLHRSGQKADKVMLHHILARGTYDERVMKVIAKKAATQDAITETTRIRLDQVRRELRLAA